MEFGELFVMNLWDIHDAEVVCRQLGYSGAIAATLRGSASFAAGTGRIWATNFACKGEEQSLLDCGHSGWGVHSCDHSSDAGVVCQTGGYFGYILILHSICIIVICKWPGKERMKYYTLDSHMH